MRSYLPIILVLFGISIGMPQEVYADGVCTPNKEFNESFKDGAAAEKAGNFALAFAAYHVARDKEGVSCEGPNQISKDAQAGWKRTGQRLAKEAEAKGNLYSEGTYTKVTTEATRSFGPDFYWAVWTDVGAFQWYTRIDESAEADRVMFRFAQSKPKDYDTVGTALAHFLTPGQPVNVNADFAETFLEMEKQGKSNPGDQQLQRKVGYVKELQKIAFKNVDEALVQEEKAYSRYNRKETVLGQGPIDESLQHLSVARDWYDLFSNLKINKVARPAENRGDAMMQDERPKSFSYARQYYGLGGHSEKIKELTEQANKLGNAAAKKNEYATAVKYYEIGHSDTGENEGKINELQSRLEKENEKKEQAKQKALQDMTKDEKQQKEFKKGQEELEKELGF